MILYGENRAKKLNEFEHTKDGFILSARGIIRNHFNQIIVLFDKRFQSYCTPGGKIDKGESIVSGLERELSEELDVKVKTTKLILSKKIVSQYGAYLQSTFLIDIDGEPKIAESEKLDQIEFIDLKKEDNELGFSAYIGLNEFTDYGVLNDSLFSYWYRDIFPDDLKGGDFPFNMLNINQILDDEIYILYFDKGKKEYFIEEKSRFEKGDNNIILYRQSGVHLKNGIIKIAN